jgi:hypothetical protein
MKGAGEGRQINEDFFALALSLISFPSFLFPKQFDLSFYFKVF